MPKRTLHTYETVETLRTDGQFRRAYKRNAAEQSKLTDKFIEAGRGTWRPQNEIKAAADQGDEMAVEYFALVDEACALSYRAERWFGRQPYAI
jgi:hypothetical protein